MPPGSFRNETYSEYKANRDETPEDIKRSVPWILEVLEGLNVPAISKVGYEADDVIGFLAKKAAAEGFDVYMMTPDKDFGQLVTDKIRMFRPGRGGNPAEVWGPDEIREKFDVDEPLQVIDLLGMMGDSADNIPGIPGVGAKTASKLLHQYGSLEGVIEHSGELKGKLKERVEENTELALLSKELATICLDIPMEYDWASMTLDAPQAETFEAPWKTSNSAPSLGAFWAMPRPPTAPAEPLHRPLLLRTSRLNWTCSVEVKPAAKPARRRVVTAPPKTPQPITNSSRQRKPWMR